MPDFIIRPAVPGDADGMVGIFSGVRAQAGTLQLPYPSPVRWRSRMARAAQYQLVAVAGGTVIGEISLIPSGDPRRRHAADLGMVVHDDWQGRGAGTALMAAALDLADRDLGLSRIGLEVYADNEAALALYRRHGFAVEATCPGHALRDGVFVTSLRMARLRGTAPSVPFVPAPSVRAVPAGAVRIRHADSADAVALQALYAEPDVSDPAMAAPRLSEAVLRAQIETLSEGTFRLVAEAGGQPVGDLTLALCGALRRRHVATLAVAVRADLQGQGIGSRLVAAALDMADHWLDVRRIELQVPQGHAAALRLFGRHGFAEEGTGQDVVHIRGALRPVVYLARLRGQ